MADQISKPFQFFVRLLDGKSVTLSFSSPLAYGNQIKQRIFEHTKIPTHLQRLIYGGYQISDESAISQPDATVNLVLSLRGGKGGFGSLLRGAATKAGQKKTNNFDACRDMSGRRLRHVNAEKRLEEWKEGEEERQLEKIADEFLKKHAKKVKQGVGNGATQKYVKKYREESDKCIEAVDLALQESFKNGKRKGKMVAESENKKRLKMWMGKSAVEDSDSDDSSDDEEDEKSVVLNSGSLRPKKKKNSGSQVSSDKNTDESSGSVVAGVHVGDSPCKASCSSGSEEEKDFVVHQSSDVVKGEVSIVQASKEERTDELPVSVADTVDQTEKKENSSGDGEQKTDDLPVSVTDAVDQIEKKEKSSGDGEGNLVEVAPETLITSEAVDAVCNKPDEPLNFDAFNSASDMEVLGMERLKNELQSRGLKCGGTLQERAARLFLLKTTPLEKLPKKLLAKK